MGRHGENIRKRRDGRWEARFLAGRDGAGRATYRYFYGKTYLEAKTKRTAAAEALRSGAPAAAEPAGILFRQAAREWLAQQRDRVKESSLAHYTNVLERQILPALGSCPVSELNGGRLEYFFRAKLTNGRLDGTGGLAPKTVADMRSILAQVLDLARKKGYAAAAVPLPAVPVRQPQISVLTQSEQKKLEQVLFESREPVCLGILAALYAGLRIGEVCALRWSDFSFEEGTVHVCRTLLRIKDPSPGAPSKTKILIQPPKTPCAIRTIPLPDFLAAYLREHRNGDGYLLTGTERYMEPRACLKKYKRLLRQAGLGDFTFHALRHTFATRCVEHDFDVKSLSEIMGHSSVNITMQRYVHPSMDLKRQQMNRLAKM